VRVLIEAREREIPPIAFPERVRRCLETLPLRAVCIAGNRDQLYQLCQELEEDYGLESYSLDPESTDTEAARKALTRADIIVSTSLHATVAHSLGEQWRKPVVVTRLRADIMADLTRTLARGPVYFIATDPKFAEALHTIFAPAGLEHNVRLVIIDRDGLEGIPEGAPVTVMRGAESQIAGTALAGRATIHQRVFSEDTARELLTLIVRANMAALTTGRMDTEFAATSG